MRVYVRICVCACVCMCVCMYIRVYVFVCLYVKGGFHRFLDFSVVYRLGHACMCMCMYVRMYVCMCMCACSCVREKKCPPLFGFKDGRKVGRCAFMFVHTCILHMCVGLCMGVFLYVRVRERCIPLLFRFLCRGSLSARFLFEGVYLCIRVYVRVLVRDGFGVPVSGSIFLLVSSSFSYAHTHTHTYT